MAALEEQRVLEGLQESRALLDYRLGQFLGLLLVNLGIRYTIVILIHTVSTVTFSVIEISLQDLHYTFRGLPGRRGWTGWLGRGRPRRSRPGWRQSGR